MKHFLPIVGLLFVSSTQMVSAKIVATYQFNNILSADEATSPALTALNSGSFVTDNVFGQTRTVYERTTSSNASSDQSALQLDTTGLSLTANNYAVELVFTFTDSLDPRAPNTNYRRILNSNDQDPGFYVGPANSLSIYQNGPHKGGSDLINGTYYDVVLSVSPSGEKAYINGSEVISYSGTPDSIQSNFLKFFNDDVYEYGNGKVALIRIFDSSLSSNDVASLNNNGNPFPTAVPLSPAIFNMLSGLITGLFLYGRRTLPA